MAKFNEINVGDRDFAEAVLDLELREDLPGGVDVDGEHVVIPARRVASMLRMARKHDLVDLVDTLEFYGLSH